MSGEIGECGPGRPSIFIFWYLQRGAALMKGERQKDVSGLRLVQCAHPVCSSNGFRQYAHPMCSYSMVRHSHVFMPYVHPLLTRCAHSWPAHPHMTRLCYPHPPAQPPRPLSFPLCHPVLISFNVIPNVIIKLGTCYPLSSYLSLLLSCFLDWPVDALTISWALVFSIRFLL